MSITEKIAKDNTCINYAKSIDSKLYKDFFQDAIEKILKLEAKGKVFDSKYRGYFYLTLLSVKNDYYRKDSNTLEKPTKNIEINIPDSLEVDKYGLALDTFLSKTYTNHKDELSKVITELTLTMDKKKICETTGYSLQLIYVYLDHAKILIRNEYDRIISY